MDKTFSIFYLPRKDKFLYCEDPINAFVYYKDFKIDLISGGKTNISLQAFWNELKSHKLEDHYRDPHVIHLFYDLGNDLYDEEDLIPSNEPLALKIHYANFAIWEQLPFEDPGKLNITPTEYPVYDEYKRKFSKIFEHLLAGDCYQVNLTAPFYFKFSEEYSVREFLGRIWRDKMNISAYAHCTYIHGMDKLILSNSPECLFQVYARPSGSRVVSLPIKGTTKFDGRNWKSSWQKLKNSQKDQAELYMITDLIRNDMARIDERVASVLHKKRPLVVPGIVHQYSVVEKYLEQNTNLFQLVQALFPGGSITGAPKKRVMQIIAETEKRSRGIYCGSTLLMHRTLKAASINIRTAEIDFGECEIRYGAGGGITLLSEVEEEFNELYLKMQSFLQLIS